MLLVLEEAPIPLIMIALMVYILFMGYHLLMLPALCFFVMWQGQRVNARHILFMSNQVVIQNYQLWQLSAK